MNSDNSTLKESPGAFAFLQKLEDANLYRHLLESLPLAVFTCDKNGYIQSYNKAAVDLWGAEPVLGKDQWCGSIKISRIDGNPIQIGETPLATAIREGIIKPGEEVMLTRFDGSMRVITPYQQPITNPAGEIEGVINVIMDVTQQKKSERALHESESRYEQLMQGLPAAVYTCNTEGYIQLFNRAAENLWGRKPRVGIDKWNNLLKLFHTDGTPMPLHESPMEKALKGEVSEENETEIIVKREDGTERIMIPHLQTLRDSSGKICGAVNMMLDITEEKRAKQKIEDSQQKLSIAIEAAQLGTWELNLKTKAVQYSRQYLEILGFKDVLKLDHSKLLELIHPDDLELRNQKMKEGMETGSINYELRIRKPDQSIHWIKAQGKVIYDEEGKPDRMLGTIHDVTDRKLVEEELEKRVRERTEELQHANLKLERSNHELEQYAYIASHDLQEPLRKISTYSGILYQQLVQKYDKPAAAVLQKVISSAERMSNLIYDLLNFSRFAKPDSTLESTDLNVIIKDIISDFELAIEQKKARIEVENLPVIQAVPLQMNQLFYNLLNNALKFYRKDIAPKIIIKAKQLDPIEVRKNKNLNPQLNYYDITVSDNGIGFNQSNAEQIFEVFKRLHNKDTYPGSGIGLALCRKIVINHQGDIFAEGMENMGSVFHAILPADLRKK